MKYSLLKSRARSMSSGSGISDAIEASFNSGTA
jgi:hypothetical protein